MKKQVYSYSLSINGLFGRNRKVKHESFDLVEVEQELSQEEVEKLADEKVKALKVKGIAQIRVTVNPVILEDFEGMSIRTYTIALGMGQKPIVSKSVGA